MRIFSRRECLKWVLRAGGGVLLTSRPPEWGWAQSRTASKEPLAIVIWGGPYMEGARALFDEFTSRTGIPVNVELHAGGAAAVLSRIKADLPRVTRDVVAAFDPVFLAMAREGWLDEITGAKVPRMGELSPLAQFRDPVTQKVVALGWTVADYGWFYRTDLVPKDLQPIVSVEQLLDPRLKGKIYFPPPISGFGTPLISLALAKGGDEKNMEPGWQILRELAQRGQIGGLPKSDSEKYQAIATGDAWITWGSSGAAVATLVPLARVKSESLKAYALIEGFSVIKGSPRIEQAYEWMKFFYTPENIGRLTSATKQPPSHPKVSVDPISSKFFFTIDEQKKYVFRPDFPYVVSEVNNWVRRFEVEILPIIQRR